MEPSKKPENTGKETPPSADTLFNALHERYRFLLDRKQHYGSVDNRLLSEKELADLRAINEEINQITFRNHNPPTAVDIVVFRGEGIHAEVLIIERLNEPYGMALPGGFQENGQTFESAAERELFEETGILVKATNMRFAMAVSDPARDPRKHVNTIVYWTVVGEWANPLAGDDAKVARFIPVRQALESKKMVLGHDQILEQVYATFLFQSRPGYAHP